MSPAEQMDYDGRNGHSSEQSCRRKDASLKKRAGEKREGQRLL